MYKNNIKLILYLILVLLYIFSIRISKNCHWNSGSVYKYFSTKTPYNFIRGDIRDSKVKLEGCEPVSIWGMFRHGKRKPSTSFSDRIVAAISIRNFIEDSYKNGRSSLCAQEVENLRNWEYDSKSFDGIRDITEEWHKEIRDITKRLKEAFPELQKDLPKGSYTFRPAKNTWIENSIGSFVSGLGQNLTIEDAMPVDVMNPYITGNKYLQNVKEKLDTNIYAEYEKYLNSSEYLVTKDRIQRRTGIEYRLTDENVAALYNLCCYSWSTDDFKPRPWCVLFTKEDLEVLEYAEDLRAYYKNSYGTVGNEVFGRIPLGDLFTSFDNVTKGGGKKIIAYLTRSSMLDQIYTALGLFKDSNSLTATYRDPNRKFRPSRISALAANLVAVLNRCNRIGSEEYNVVFYLNEEPLRSICEEGVCSWEDFNTKFRPFVNATTEFYRILQMNADN